MNPLRSFFLTLALSMIVGTSLATVDIYEFSDEDKYERYKVLTEELRCPKCQNQNIADSDAQIAKDLRQEVHRLVEAGQSDDQVVSFMVERYGDFVRYRPAMEGAMLGLWWGPVVIVLTGIPLLVFWVRRRRQADAGSIERGLDDQEKQRLKRLLDKDEGDRQ